MSIAAIIGRPNVGKSTIFNILTGSKSAIVADFSGITRDRKYGNLKDSLISLIDTGGLNEESDDISFIIKEQTDLAIQEADVILFVVDAIDGLLPLDKEISLSLRKQNKEIILLVNKTDNEMLEESASEFNSLGFKIELTKKAKIFVADKGYDEKYGARPLNRAIQKHIEDPLAEEIIQKNVKEGDLIKIDLNSKSDKITVSIVEKKKSKSNKT